MGGSRMYYVDKLTWAYWIEPIVMLILAIIMSIWATRMAIKYERIKRRMTKRIKVQITHVMRGRYNTCVYRFAGRGEYEGITFYDPWLRTRPRHEKGTVVPLLINEYNLKEFYFEEVNERVYRNSAIFSWIVTFLVLVFEVIEFLRLLY